MVHIADKDKKEKEGQQQGIINLPEQAFIFV